jgi:hypothetical protein
MKNVARVNAMSRRTTASLAIASSVTTALAITMCGCGASQALPDLDSRGVPVGEEIAGARPEEFLIWIDWSRWASKRDAIYVDDRGNAFRYSHDVAQKGPAATLVVYRDVRLSDSTLNRLLSVKHAADFSPGDGGTETNMRSCVVCAHETNCSVHQLHVRNSDLLDAFGELESALAKSEGRSIDPKEYYDELKCDIFPENASTVIDAWNLEEIRPQWIAEAWERAGQRER